MFSENYCASKARLPEFLTKQEANRLIDGVTDLKDKTILEVLYATGARPKELRSIRISNIDLETREIRVMGKDGGNGYIKERILLLTQRATDLIKAYLTQRKPTPGYQDILFINDKGIGLTAQELNKIVKEYVRDILGKEIKHKNPAYILRHSAATALMNNDVDLPYISEFLGHKNFSSTQVYTHTNIERLIKVHRACHPRELPLNSDKPKSPTENTLCLEWAKGILGK